jgi:predicted amidophosphoribosyltransferase
LNQQQRRENVLGVFTASKNLSGKTVLIIDDTITTGSTLNECTKALLNAGAKGVFVLTFAKSIADEQIFRTSL